MVSQLVKQYLSRSRYIIEEFSSLEGVDFSHYTFIVVDDSSMEDSLYEAISQVETVPTILLSSDFHCQVEGFEDVLFKPFMAEELLLLLDRILYAKSVEQKPSILNQGEIHEIKALLEAEAEAEAEVLFGREREESIQSLLAERVSTLTKEKVEMLDCESLKKLLDGATLQLTVTIKEEEKDEEK